MQTILGPCREVRVIVTLLVMLPIAVFLAWVLERCWTSPQRRLWMERDEYLYGVRFLLPNGILWKNVYPRINLSKEEWIEIRPEAARWLQ